MIGQILAKHWSAHGHNVIGISRNPKKRKVRVPASVAIVGWDALTPEFFEIRKINVVVNLAGAPMMQRWDKNSKREILHSRLEALERVYATMRKIPPSRRPHVVINASSVAVYSNQPTDVDESFEPDLDINFFQSLVWLKLEKRMRELNIPDIRNVIARIGLVIGPHSMMQEMFFWSRLGAGAVIGNGEQKIAWISHHDLARAFDHLIDNRTCRDIYNIVSPHYMTALQFSESIANAAGRNANFRLSEWLLRIFMGELADNFLVSAAVKPGRLTAEQFDWTFPTLDSAVNRSKWAIDATAHTLA
jgi:uncharacterized protein (TIGR01777 family)